MPLVAGSRFGRYEVRSLIGTGGMGEVYLARDTQLRRPVALKVLLEKFTASKPHLRRFEQEARATSSLNHPNILTIHEIGQHNSIYFIAAEFVVGETLRKVISRSRVEPSAAIDIAIQVSSALAAAHAAGIVHRDLKPENIMVRQDGYVKLLDFGLAKLVEDYFQQGSRTGSESAITNVKTLSGAIIGTTSYMSPEQLRGLDVDVRTDIWSVGVVLYEMIAGTVPFHGNSSADVIVGILEKQPQPLRECSPECPDLLERIIDKALTKEKEERYRTVVELLFDLRRLSEQLRLGPSHGQSSNPRLSSNPTAHYSGRVSHKSPSFVQVVRQKLGELTGHWWLSPGLIVLMAILFGSYAIYRYRHSQTLNPTTAVSIFQEGKLTKLIGSGKAMDAAISPDGKYVAYATDEGGKQSLSVRQVVGGSSVSVIPPAEVRYSGMTFSPDSNYIYYVAFEKEINQGVLYRIPVLGVQPKRILADIDTPISFSPDGTQMTFVRGYPSQKQTALMIANADGSGERKFATRGSPDDFGWKGGPAWAPDGEHIACAVGTYELSMHLVSISVKDGSEQDILPGKWSSIGRVVWLHDGSALLVVAKDESGFQQVWYASYPESTLRRITRDLTDYGPRSLSITADSKGIVLIQTDYLANIWLTASGDERSSKQIGNGRSDGFNGVSWTPDGKIAYASRASGNPDIWIMDHNGGHRTQLTFDSAANYEPSVTRDGRFIVFTSTRGGAQDVWRMDIDGNHTKQLTMKANASWPTCSPDGQFVVYKSYSSGRRTLWKVPIDGGVPVQITDKYLGWPAVSPDGRSIACEYWNEQQTGSTVSLAILSFDGESPLKVFYWPPSSGSTLYLPRVIRWTPDGNAVTYIVDQGGTGNLWSQSLEGGPPKQVTNFQSERIFWFDWSKDGKELVSARGVTESDVVMITGP